MPVATLLEFPGLTQQQYEQVSTQLGPTGAPQGILYHACGPVEGGWRIVDIWDSREAFDRFVDETYLPAIRAAGGAAPSRREVVPTYHAGTVHRG
jgi:hypothetical protein